MTIQVRRQKGFTIMEIMIATAILTLGLVGILALFPVAIDSGKKVMERSTAVTIAKSVAEQIRSGLRNQKRYNLRGAVPFTYFILQHDGVQDPIPKDSAQERPSGDYYILLPQFRAEQGFSGASDAERRGNALKETKEFVYPEDDDPPNGNGDPYQADNDADDGPNGIVVKKVYTVGSRLPKVEDVGDEVLDDQKRESFKQYSFAFSIRASKYDTNLSLNPGRFQPGNNLYHVRVMVFRAFDYNAEKVRQEGKGPEPIYEMDFEVSR